MADSSVIQISSELREIPPTPPPQSPIKTPMPSPQPKWPAPPQSPASSVVIDKTLSSAANLVKLLPTGTVLAFQSLSPSFTNKGHCYTSNKFITSTLIFLCCLSCAFFSFTDSLIGRDGKLYYGIATFKGFYLFNFEGSDEEGAKVFKNLSRFRIRWMDFVHSFFSIVVFLALTFSDTGVQTCLFPRTGNDAKELLVNLPMGAAFLASLVFVIFPTSRKGIGYSDAAPHAQGAA